MTRVSDFSMHCRASVAESPSSTRCPIIDNDAQRRRNQAFCNLHVT